MKKENKEAVVSVRLTHEQESYLEKIKGEKLLKNRSAVIQYLINKNMTLGG
jgi:hypothetical protein